MLLVGKQRGSLMLRWWTLLKSTCNYCLKYQDVGFGWGIGFSMLYFALHDIEEETFEE